MIWKSRLFIFACVLVATRVVAAESRSHLRLEFGNVSSGYNTFTIPKATGTRVELPEESTVTGRIQAEIPLSSKSDLRILLAPLSLTYRQPLTTPVEFSGSTLNSGSQLKTKYKFNSYRLGYLYRLLDDRHRLRIGAIAKVRDAAIEVSDSALTKRKSNVGLVPLLHVDWRWNLSRSLYFDFDLDGLASPQGRAFDGAVELGWQAAEPLAIGAFYRVLEGGANNDNLRNFARFQFYGLSLNFSL